MERLLFDRLQVRLYPAKNKKRLIFLLISFFLVFATSCTDLSFFDFWGDDDKKTGSIQITMPGLSQSRSLPLESDIVRFELTLVSLYMETQTKGVSPDSPVLPGETIIFDELVQGFYDLDVKAFDEFDKLIFTGEKKDIEVKWATTTYIELELNYATGKIVVTFSYPDETCVSCPPARVAADIIHINGNEQLASWCSEHEEMCVAVTDKNDVSSLLKPINGLLSGVLNQESDVVDVNSVYFINGYSSVIENKNFKYNACITIKNVHMSLVIISDFFLVNYSESPSAQNSAIYIENVDNFSVEFNYIYGKTDYSEGIKVVNSGTEHGKGLRKIERNYIENFNTGIHLYNDIFVFIYGNSLLNNNTAIVFDNSSESYIGTRSGFNFFAGWRNWAIEIIGSSSNNMFQYNSFDCNPDSASARVINKTDNNQFKTNSYSPDYSVNTHSIKEHGVGVLSTDNDFVYAAGWNGLAVLDISKMSFSNSVSLDYNNSAVVHVYNDLDRFGAGGYRDIEVRKEADRTFIYATLLGSGLSIYEVIKDANNNFLSMQNLSNIFDKAFSDYSDIFLLDNYAIVNTCTRFMEPYFIIVDIRDKTKPFIVGRYILGSEDGFVGAVEKASGIYVITAKKFIKYNYGKNPDDWEIIGTIPESQYKFIDYQFIHEGGDRYCIYLIAQGAYGKCEISDIENAVPENQTINLRSVEGFDNNSGVIAYDESYVYFIGNITYKHLRSATDYSNDLVLNNLAGIPGLDVVKVNTQTVSEHLFFYNKREGNLAMMKTSFLEDYPYNITESSQVFSSTNLAGMDFIDLIRINNRDYALLADIGLKIFDVNDRAIAGSITIPGLHISEFMQIEPYSLLYCEYDELNQNIFVSPNASDTKNISIYHIDDNIESKLIGTITTELKAGKMSLGYDSANSPVLAVAIPDSIIIYDAVGFYEICTLPVNILSLQKEPLLLVKDGYLFASRVDGGVSYFSVYSIEDLENDVFEPLIEKDRFIFINPAGIEKEINVNDIQDIEIKDDYIYILSNR